LLIVLNTRHTTKPSSVTLVFAIVPFTLCDLHQSSTSARSQKDKRHPLIHNFTLKYYSVCNVICEPLTFLCFPCNTYLCICLYMYL
jgi:hypothetical protein